MRISWGQLPRQAEKNMLSSRKRPGVMTVIKKAKDTDLQQVARLAALLWPDHTAGELMGELSALLEREDAAFFLAWEEDRAVGFAQCQLRRDYVEGTEHSPVGYLEGIFVEEPFRRRGLAGDLLSACEQWAAERGCREFASDCELDNTQSQIFHNALGFQEANRIVCFVKQL